jgi:Flp pilus assembly protein TadB
MPDKMEREIEEILAKLDNESPRSPLAEKAPVSILSRRKHTPGPAARARAKSASLLNGINPATLLFLGAGIMIGGLVFSTVYEPLIWASFAGVVLFLLAFVWSFRRTPRYARSGAAGSTPQGHYWRDRYIEYQPQSSSLGDRIKRRFRR